MLKRSMEEEKINKFIRKCLWRRQRTAVCLNTVDPITQEEVAAIRWPFYVYVGPSRAFVTLDAIATSEYILATGDTRNPVTREDFNVVELRRLDKLTAGRGATSVVDNLSAARDKAARDLEQAQLCQAMEMEPAALWSLIMQAPYSAAPQIVIEELDTFLKDYAVSIWEYATVNRTAALQFHGDNLRNFLGLDVTCGDMVVFERVLEILAQPSVKRLLTLQSDSSDSSDSDVSDESGEDGALDVETVAPPILSSPPLVENSTDSSPDSEDGTAGPVQKRSRTV